MNLTTHSTSFDRTLLLAVAASILTSGTVHAQQIDMNAWRQSGEYRAMKLQRELSADMTQDQSLLLGSHNSYNSSAYGLVNYANSQHSYSLSEQLDLGLRSLDLDVHAVVGSPNNLWLAHTTCFGAGVNLGHRTVRQGLLEIRSWMNENPDEVVFVNIEQHFPMSYPSAQHTHLTNAIEEIFGGGNAAWGPDVLIRPSEIWAEYYQDPFQDWAYRVRKLTSESTLSGLRLLGRVAVLNIGGVTPPCSSNYWPDYHPTTNLQNCMFGNAPSFSWCGSSNLNYIHARDFADHPGDQYWGILPFGIRTRETCDETSTNSVLYNNTSAGQYDDYGSEPPAVVREAVRAGMDGIRFDPVGRSLGLPGNPIEFDAAEQMRATIWSWDWRYTPPLNDGQPRAAMAVIQGDTALIRWEVPAAEMRYALQDGNGQWSISAERGNFAAAPANCRVPGNGFEMQNLFGEMVRAGITKVWINYHDLDGNGVWIHSTQNRNFSASIPLPIISPVPFLVTNTAEIVFMFSYWNVTPMPPTGRVLGVLPGSYPGAFIFSSPLTIVPAEHGHPVSLGRP